MEKDFEENGTLGDLIRRLPAGEPPAGMEFRIMERIRTEAARSKRRAERLCQAALIGLVVLVAGGGVTALWLFVPAGIPFRPIDGLRDAAACFKPASGTPCQGGGVGIYLFGLLAVVLLLLFDCGMRRLYRERHR